MSTARTVPAAQPVSQQLDGGGRRDLPCRISWSDYNALAALAAIETGGNVSEMVRKLLGEALAARARSIR